MNVLFIYNVQCCREFRVRIDFKNRCLHYQEMIRAHLCLTLIFVYISTMAYKNLKRAETHVPSKDFIICFSHGRFCVTVPIFYKLYYITYFIVGTKRFIEDIILLLPLLSSCYNTELTFVQYLCVRHTYCINRVMFGLFAAKANIILCIPL